MEREHPGQTRFTGDGGCHIVMILALRQEDSWLPAIDKGQGLAYIPTQVLVTRHGRDEDAASCQLLAYRSPLRVIVAKVLKMDGYLRPIRVKPLRQPHEP
jgi:hypothetical protein